MDMDLSVLRDDMVDSLEHPANGVIRSESIALAMRDVPRHLFISDERAAHADRSHREAGTTVFAPSTTARLLEALSVESGHTVLVVGAGVGYTSAVIAEIVGPANVHAIDLSSRIVRIARQNLRKAGAEKVLVDHGDAANGLPAYAPYDRILVEAGALEPPRALLSQLAPDGRLVVPRGGQIQELVAYEYGEIIDTYGTIVVDPLLVPGEEPGAIERNRTAREDREFAARINTRRSGWEQEWIDWEQAND